MPIIHASFAGPGFPRPPYPATSPRPGGRDGLRFETEIRFDEMSDAADPLNLSGGSQAATEEPPATLYVPHFDLRTAESLSFATLEQARQSVYRTPDRREAFERSVDGLATTGEEGRRRGLGRWVLADYRRCVEELAPYEKDDTASYTRARALSALRRHEEARAIFQRLSSAYPTEPRPRTGVLETKLELEYPGDHADAGPLADELEGLVLGAPADYADSADGHYMLGRIAELRHDWETALDHYRAGRDVDGAHRRILTRFAHLAERCGLDELAIQLYEVLVQMAPCDKRVLINLGVLYEDMGRDSDAAACYDTVVKNAPTDELARLYLEDAKAAMHMYYDEDLERKEDRLNQILRIPITDFELSVRARNCLNKMQITTLGDLVQRTEQELLSYKNFGETSLTEIKEILHSKGLRLGMPREEAVASIEAHANRTATGDRADVLNKPILELQLSIRARRTVEALGCLTVGEITKHSAEELLGMPNFGQTSLQELRNKLAELGLKLKGD